MSTNTRHVAEGPTPATARDVDHPLRGRFNSWLLHALDSETERAIGPYRDQLVAALANAREIVEIGPGNGPLFDRMRPGTRVHAVEPNRWFHGRLRAAARSAGVDLVLHATGAEAIDLPDDSVDAAVSTWVLCTVAEPAAVLAEIRRVLRPGGRLLFLEHVQAPPGGRRRVQRAVRRPWAWLFEGCQTGRDTAAAIRGAGFAEVDLRTVDVDTPLVPIRSQILGHAIA